MNWVSTAKRMRESGLSVVPIRKVDSWIDPWQKNYSYKWKKYQTSMMTEAEIEREFKDAWGIGIVTGRVSGIKENHALILIDFDDGIAKYEQWMGQVQQYLPEIIEKFVIESTGKAGRHVYVRVDFGDEPIPGCAKWARVLRDKTEKIAIGVDGGEYVGEVPANPATIETRAEPGLVFCYPTPGYKMLQGKLLEIPTITFDEFSVLEALARSLDEVGGATVPDKHVKVENAPYATGDRPGDVYNRTVEWDELLGDMGATVQFRKGDRLVLCRPGKKKGVSGTTGNGRAGQDLFYCFSSNWHPFEEGKCYSKFKVFTMLRHGDDWNKSTKAAAEQLGLIRTVKKENPLKVESGGGETSTGALALNVEPEGIEWHPSDMGNAEQFALAAAGKLMYCHELKRWVQWTGARWDLSAVGNTSAVTLYRELIAPLKQSDPAWWAKCMAAARMRATIASAADFADMSCTPADFDNDPMILNTQDGIVHLGTGDLIPHDPKYLCSKITACGVTYSESDQAVVSRFIAEICGDDDASIESLQRLLGYSITGHIEQQKFVLAVGRGRNGKGTLTNTLQKLLGEYATSLESDMILSSKLPRSQFDLEQLRGARFVKVEEPDARRMLDREFIKRLVGGDSMRVAAKFGTPYVIWPICKLWLISNHKPRVEFDYAFERRAIVFPFTLNLAEEDVDPALESKLIAAGGALLAWIIGGSVAYHEAESDKLPSTERMRAELASYKEDNDNLKRFLDEMTEVDSNAMAVGYTESTKLVHAFNDWAKVSGTSQMNHQEFVQRMRVKGHETEKVGHNNLKGYKGIVLISDDRSY